MTGAVRTQRRVSRLGVLCDALRTQGARGRDREERAPVVAGRSKASNNGETTEVTDLWGCERRDSSGGRGRPPRGTQCESGGGGCVGVVRRGCGRSGVRRDVWTRESPSSRVTWTFHPSPVRPLLCGSGQDGSGGPTGLSDVFQGRPSTLVTPNKVRDGVGDDFSGKSGVGVRPGVGGPSGCRRSLDVSRDVCPVFPWVRGSP